MRGPMLVCGLATLVLFPLYVAPRLGGATAAVFAVLLAISPLLVVYSRMARPYAITLLLGWFAHARVPSLSCSVAGPGRSPALTYGAAATLATWLHPVVAPFVLAPFAVGAPRLRRVPAERRARFTRLAAPRARRPASRWPRCFCRPCSRIRRR